jgi:hypothetical protein
MGGVKLTTGNGGSGPGGAGFCSTTLGILTGGAADEERLEDGARCSALTATTHAATRSRHPAENRMFMGMIVPDHALKHGVRKYTNREVRSEPHLTDPILLRRWLASDDSPATDQPDEEQHHGDHEQNPDEVAKRIAAHHSEQPQNDQDNRNGLEHVSLPQFRARGSSPASGPRGCNPNAGR